MPFGFLISEIIKSKYVFSPGELKWMPSPKQGRIDKGFFASTSKRTETDPVISAIPHKLHL